jgi:hypothetical protein
MRSSSWSRCGALALQQSTQTIPIVFVNVADALGAGLVESLSRPGGNTTGFTNFNAHRQMLSTISSTNPAAEIDAARTNNTMADNPLSPTDMSPARGDRVARRHVGDVSRGPGPNNAPSRARPCL